MSVYKVDGIGTRKDGSGGQTANLGEGNIRIIRMIGFSADSSAAVTYTKGDLVALQLASATVNGSNVVDAFGKSNVIKKASSGTEVACVGVVAETVTATYNSDSSKGSTVIVPVQISGIFIDANVATGSTSGKLLFPSSTSGRGALEGSADPDTHKAYAIGVKDAADNKGDILLLNPLQY